MDATAAGDLKGLGFVERALSSSVTAAAGRLPDEALAAQVRSFAETHGRHAEAIDAMLARMSATDVHVPPEYEARVARLEDGLARSEAVESVLVGLVQAERAIVDLYEVPLGEGIGADDAAALRDQQRTEQRHVDYLESRGALVVPELIDLGRAGGSGYSVP